MKKLLVIVVLIFLSSVKSFAGCSDFIDFSWKYIGKDRTTHVKQERAYYAKFTFKSTSDKSIQITSTRLFTSNDQLVKKDQLDKLFFTIEKTFLDNKKNIGFWVRLTKLYIVKFKIVRYIKFILSAGNSIINKTRND